MNPADSSTAWFVFNPTSGTKQRIPVFLPWQMVYTLAEGLLKLFLCDKMQEKMSYRE